MYVSIHIFCTFENWEAFKKKKQKLYQQFMSPSNYEILNFLVDTNATSSVTQCIISDRSLRNLLLVNYWIQLKVDGILSSDLITGVVLNKQIKDYTMNI